MTMGINRDGILMSFMTFTMLESFAPTATAYGTNEDANNRNIIVKDDYCFTLVKDGENYYFVHLYDDGAVGFGASPKYSLDFNDYSDDRRQTRNGLTVFNKFIYVILTLADNTYAEKLYFAAANPALGVIYGRAVKNKFVLDKMRQSGWEFIGMTDDEWYTFQRTS